LRHGNKSHGVADVEVGSSRVAVGVGVDKVDTVVVRPSAVGSCVPTEGVWMACVEVGRAGVTVGVCTPVMSGKTDVVVIALVVTVFSQNGPVNDMGQKHRNSGCAVVASVVVESVAELTSAAVVAVVAVTVVAVMNAVLLVDVVAFAAS